VKSSVDESPCEKSVDRRDKVLECDLYCIIEDKSLSKKEPMTPEAAERIAKTSKDPKFVERAKEAAKKK
jgi:hypothetical protein